MPKISIIVPVYNVESLLERCLNSICAQTYSNWECILIDDGSKDKSGDICDKYASNDTRFLVRHTANRGVSAARNTGIETATGEWICCIDSDDYVSKTYLEDFGLHIYDADLYAQGYQIVVEEVVKREITITSETIKLSSQKAFSILEDNDIINSPVFKLYKNSIIKDHYIKFRTNTSYGEDHLFSIEYLLHCKNIVIASSCGYNNDRTGTNSLSRRCVPFDNNMYYVNSLCDLYDQLLRKKSFSQNIDVNKSISYRIYCNWIRLLKDLYTSNIKCYEKYCIIYDWLLKYRNFNTGIPKYGKFLYGLYFTIPKYVTFILFGILIKVQSLKNSIL